MSEQKSQFKEGQRVWHKGRPATFFYYAREDAATIRFEGNQESTVVSVSGLSEEPDAKPES